ncbi:transcriptional activator protein acu-15 [Podospora australis]|uniref:Transcriptional activator protein acu-15 n=1 Tax=Podospora australis TaxID=1536484 RepID=A0AAN6WRH8_9PEZI|nr:transcriptional activator protein acu-15 [Podospora australis]
MSPTSSSAPGAPPSGERTSNIRPKRSQVSRACDWCRVHRIKCDAEQPCHNCRSRGGTCSTTGASEIRTLPHAFREIERLKRRVKELEQEIERRDRAAAASLPTPNQYDLWREHDFEQRPLAGLYTSNGNMPQKQLFGPSSLFYFIGRMTNHLAAFLEHPPADHTIQYSSNAKSFVDTPGLEPNLTQRGDQPMGMGMGLTMGVEGQSTGDPYTYLTAMQEEYFLNFFWQSYHCSFQIVDEASFKEHYRSLWASGNSKTRKPSALVDIILALCIQLEYDPASSQRGNNKAQAADADTELAGRWHYQRCQTLLISELESPTISTLQCHIFSVIYLCCASFQNMAASTLALAVRTAHILGLHLEPPQELPRTERELRKRLWWTLYTLESKTCMKLGRPWSAPISDTQCSLPSDDHQLAIHSGSAALAGGNVTWLTYTLQNTKLVLSARNVYVSFYHEAARILGSSSSPTIYDDPAVLEACANLLKGNMAALDIWIQSVPDALKTKRKRGGEPFSTDGSRLAIEAFAPLWLQRQRLFLELLYHNLSIILYRPLISFTPTGGAPTAEACSAQCVSHAITMTHHIHQALSETDLLKGWHESFQWQWNGAITIIGFILANPLSPQVAAARESIRLAVEVFEIFGKQFAVGRRAAKVVRELMMKGDMLLSGLQAELANLPPVVPTAGVDATAVAAADPLWNQVNAGVNLAGLGEGADATLSTMMQDSPFDAIRLQDVLTGTMDVAFSVDSYNSFELLQGSNMNFPDLWAFTAEA